MTRYNFYRPLRMCSSSTSVHVIFIITVISCTFPMTRSAWASGDDFREDINSMVNKGLGVQAWQDYFDTLSFTADIPNGQTLLDQIVAKLEHKFSKRIGQVKKLKTSIEANYGSFTGSKTMSECCKIINRYHFDEKFNMAVDIKNACVQISSTSEHSKKYVSSAVVSKFIANFQSDSSLKWQYFGDENGVLTMYPANKFTDCGTYDPRYRPWYVAAVTSTKKAVVIVIDRSRSMISKHDGRTLMSIAKRAANTVLETLGPDDLVGVVTFSTSSYTAGGCYDKFLAVATQQNIARLKRFVSNSYQQGGTSYVRALTDAFNLFKESSDWDSPGYIREKVILFLSDGVPNENTTYIMSTIRRLNSEMKNKVIILTYGLGERLGATAKNVLRRMSQQDTYDTSAGNVTKGLFRWIENPSTLRSSMASYYNFFSRANNSGSPIVSEPYFDAFGLGMILTVSMPIFDGGSLAGVVGLDIPLSDLFAEAIFNRHYIFVIDDRGRTLIHPLLPQPNNVHAAPIVANIDVFERNAGTKSVISSMKSGGSGSKSFLSDHIITNGNSFRDGIVKQTLDSTFYWKKINGSDFSACLVMVNGDVEPHISGLPSRNKFLYHRIDLVAPTQTCKHFNRISTKEMSVVMLGVECFVNPYQYIDQVETAATVPAITDYLTYKTTSNPGLKADIRDTVTMTAKGDDIWLKQMTEMTQYLAWRYIATYNGVFRITPGVKLQKDFNAVNRPWYRRAMSLPGKAVFSAPYLDAFGAGYVVTLSYTLYKGSPTKKHTSSDTVVAVAGADFTLGYFYQTLIERFPKCTQESYSCFLMDTSGYIVINQTFVEGVKAVLPEVEDVHVTVRDKIFAERMIKYNYMTRQKCLNVVTMNYQNTWKVDLGGKSLVELKSPSIPQYEVTPISGSNVFLVVRYKTGRSKSSGCRCSKKSADSYKVFTCRVGSKTCQCPCRATANFFYCKNKLTIASSADPPCTPEAPALNVTQPSKSERDSAKELSFCYQRQCNNVSKKSLCVSLLGCSWCARASDGGILQKPYCASEQVCYLGVVGMPSPYVNASTAVEPNDPRVEAILGGLGVLVLIALTYVVWRQCQKKKDRTTSPTTATNTNTNTGHSRKSSSQSKNELPVSNSSLSKPATNTSSPEKRSLQMYAIDSCVNSNLDEERGQSGALTDPDTMQGQSGALTDPDTMQGQSGALTDPDTMQGQSGALTDPDTMQGQSGTLTDPDTMQGQSGALTDPDTMQGQSGALTDPDTMQGQSGALTDPDTMQGQSGALTDPDTMQGQSGALTDPDTTLPSPPPLDPPSTPGYRLTAINHHLPPMPDPVYPPPAYPDLSVNSDKC